MRVKTPTTRRASADAGPCSPGQLGGLESTCAAVTAVLGTWDDPTNSSRHAQSAHSNHGAVHWNHDMFPAPDRPSTGSSGVYPKPTGIQAAVRTAGGWTLLVSRCFRRAREQEQGGAWRGGEYAALQIRPHGIARPG